MVAPHSVIPQCPYQVLPIHFTATIEPQSFLVRQSKIRRPNKRAQQTSLLAWGKLHGVFSCSKQEDNRLWFTPYHFRCLSCLQVLNLNRHFVRPLAAFGSRKSEARRGRLHTPHLANLGNQGLPFPHWGVSNKTL